MRPGGGKEKGSEFERQTGVKLSLWVSGGARSDLFARNILSGGTFTNKLKKEDRELNMPGDLMAGHPLAFEFLSTFMIECKHYADLNFEAFLFDGGRSFLGKVMAQSRKQAKHVKLWPLIIARQNRRPTVVICGRTVGEQLMLACGRLKLPQYHSLHRGEYMMTTFDAMLATVNPAAFIAGVRTTTGDET